MVPMKCICRNSAGERFATCYEKKPDAVASVTMAPSAQATDTGRMSKIAKGLLVVTSIAVIAFIATTYLALESAGVVSVETTRSAGGGSRSTHIWYVENDGTILLEAGHPDNPWVQDLVNSASIKLSGNGIDGHYSYAISDEPDAHMRIRNLMHSKYGWRDSWIGLLFDTSQSRLVVLSRRDSQGADSE